MPNPDPPSGSAPPQPWYKDGLRFECQRSGKCCTNHGEYAYVYLTADDERRLADHFAQTLTAFRRAHTRILDGHRILRSDADQCRFLDAGACTVYPARPTQCSTWPFWRANLDPEVWARDVASFCPGVGKGPVHSHDEIEASAARQEQDD